MAYKNRRQKYREWRAKLNRLKEVPCARCNNNFPSYVMDFDHRDPAMKLGEIGQAFGRSWEEEEIQKCDVLCACCHRLRKPPVEKTGRKRQILRDLKTKPCADCGGSFHYSQMDFDHVRGQKIAPVSRLTGRPLVALLEEVAKCDVVCANCHRERTHGRKTGVLFLGDSTQVPLVSTSWQDLVGTMDDQSVAALCGVAREEVWAYRKEGRIPAYKKAPGFRWQGLVGTMSDSEIAKIGGVTRSTVSHYRRRLGVPAFELQVPEWYSWLGKISDAEIARRVGLNRSTVCERRLSKKIPTFSEARRAA